MYFYIEGSVPKWLKPAKCECLFSTTQVSKTLSTYYLRSVLVNELQN